MSEKSEFEVDKYADRKNNLHIIIESVADEKMQQADLYEIIKILFPDGRYDDKSN